MTVLLRSAQSLEYVRVPVATVDDDGAEVNPTSDAVALAFVADGETADADTTFLSGDWDTDDSDPSRPIYYARLMVGPGSDPTVYHPTSGTWVDVWVRVTDNPESPVIRAGSIRFL